MLKKIKSVSLYNWVLVAFLVLSVSFIPFFYRASAIRAVDGIKDLALSVAFYFCAFFDHDIKVTVTEMPSLDILDYLPYDFDELFRRLKDMWSVIFNADCFKAFWVKIAKVLNNLSIYAMFLLPIVPCVCLLVRSAVLSPNKDKHGELTKPLEKFLGKPYSFIKASVARVKALWQAFVGNKWLLCLTVIVWLLNLNIVTVALEAVAYYFYFAMSQNIFNIVTTQIFKLLLDVVIMFSGAPKLFWACLFYALLSLVRREKGFKTLDRLERNFRDFLKCQPICVMFCGLMGSKKTTLMTGAALSAEIMLRDKAFELILECDMKFPNFPWINLEDELKEAFKEHKIYSLSTARRWVKKKRRIYNRECDISNIFNYDVEKFRTTYDNELEIVDVWDVIEDYAQLYLVYIIESSLLVANYSIRVDNVLEHAGNFERWNSELFRRKPEAVQAVSRYAHILDYDVLRIGKTMIENNPNRGSFEFGVVVFSELGKERLNQLILKELKRAGVECNQKNDLFVTWLKMIRHKATICNFPFVRVFGDEQRPTSIEADIRELFHIVHIRESSDFEIVMPLFFIEELIHDFIYPRFEKFYEKYRYNRGDTSFIMFLLHNLVSALHTFYMRNFNLFGVAEVYAEVERGTQDGTMEEYIIPLSSKKVYSERFTTDCYVLFWEPLMAMSFMGLNDYPEYKDIKPTAEEFHMQHSFFIADMENVGATATPTTTTSTDSS